jgi:hypothetical protein
MRGIRGGENLKKYGRERKGEGEGETEDHGGRGRERERARARKRERQKRWPIRLPKVLHHVGVLALFLAQGIEVVEPPAPVRQELYNTQSVVKES